MRIQDFHEAAQYSKRAKAMSRRLAKLALADAEQAGETSECKRLAQRMFARLRERERLSRVLVVSSPCYLMM